MCAACLATFLLNSCWDEYEDFELTNNDIKRVGFHEVCELLLGRLGNMVYQRFDLNSDDVDEETHRIIRTLENAVWEPKQTKGGKGK